LAEASNVNNMRTVRLIRERAPLNGEVNQEAPPTPMARSSRTKVVPLRDSNVLDNENETLAGSNGLARQLDEPRRFPLVTTLPRLPLMIPDEILDYYGWVFCQGGFVNLHMTFEQFLAVVAAVSPSGLCPEYDDSSTTKLG
jgi:hypothetical protein